MRWMGVEGIAEQKLSSMSSRLYQDYTQRFKTARVFHHKYNLKKKVLIQGNMSLGSISSAQLNVQTFSSWSASSPISNFLVFFFLDIFSSSKVTVFVPSHSRTFPSLKSETSGA